MNNTNSIETARKQIFGFAAMMDALPLRSVAARRAMWLLPWYAPEEAGALQAELARQKTLGAVLAKAEAEAEADADAGAAGTNAAANVGANADTGADSQDRAVARGLACLRHHLETMPDLAPTFRQLREQRGALDDIQLFELKNWLLPMDETARFARHCHIDLDEIPDLSAALDLLDPLKERLPSFHIYDGYDPRLPVLRKKLKAAVEAEVGASANAEAVAGAGTGNAALVGTQPVASATATRQAERMELEAQLSDVEAAVRTTLSQKLYEWLPKLEAALRILTEWDFLLAKTEWAQAQHCCCPEIVGNAACAGNAATGSDTDTANAAPNATNAANAPNAALSYTDLFYPPLLAQCEAQGRPYQSVNITLYHDACLLTGANMSGKTILIKSLALAQTLAQFGFFVPAAHARLSLFDEITALVGDEQNESRGLSSFGAEILSLDRTLRQLRQGRRLLFLSDELARTTNPSEGRAIVCAFFDLWQQIRAAHPYSTALVSTHYENVNNAPRRLRIKGLDTARWREHCRVVGQIVGQTIGQTAANSANANTGGQIETASLQTLQSFMNYDVEEVSAHTPIGMQALDVAACLGVDEELIQTAKQYTTNA